MLLVLADAVATMTKWLAVATAVMAIATVLLAVVTYCGNRSARKTAADQLTASYLPVIVPYQRSAETLKYRGGTISVDGGPHITGNPQDRSDLPRYSAAMVAVENVGVGPALNLRGDYEGPKGHGSVRVPLEAVAAGATGILTFENREGASLDYASPDKVSMLIVYNDAAGQEYRRRIVYNPMEHAYIESKFEHRPGWHS